jgi:exopolysaccharide production protein ExoZ
VRAIQYLRGLAAFGVLVFHAAERAGHPFGTGAAGVDVFFVISGFIMWVVTSGRPVSPAEFLQRRVERIVPLYWGLTLLTAAAAIAVPALFPAMQPSAGHVLKSLFFVPHADPTGLIAPLVVPGWTLNYEMFFYILFAATLLAPARARPYLLTAVLVGLAAARPLGDITNPLWSTYSNNLLLEFAAGVWLGKAWREHRLPGRAAGWTMVALGLAGFVAVALSGVDVERARALLWGVPALLLVAGAVSLEQAGPIPAMPPLRALGDASYSVYLVHGLAISAAFRLLQRAGVTSLPILFAAALIAGVAAGLAAYHLVEKPLMALFKTGLAARRSLLSPAKREGEDKGEGGAGPSTSPQVNQGPSIQPRGPTAAGAALSRPLPLSLRSGERS